MCHYVLLQFQCPVLKEFKLTFAARNRKHYFCVIQRCSSNCQVLKNSTSWKIETWNCFCFLKVMKIHIFQIKKYLKVWKTTKIAFLHQSPGWFCQLTHSMIFFWVLTWFIRFSISLKFYLLLGRIDPWWYIRNSICCLVKLILDDI